MKKFESVIKNFVDTLKHFDKKQKKALLLLLDCELLERLSDTLPETDLKMLAYSYLCSEDILWEHKDFEYPNEFEQVWDVYYLGGYYSSLGY